MLTEVIALAGEVTGGMLVIRKSHQN